VKVHDEDLKAGEARTFKMDVIARSSVEVSGVSNGVSWERR
jgi:hypothetical protein